jgi:hypothetical protein
VTLVSSLGLTGVVRDSSVLLTKYYSRDQIKKNEMGRARGTWHVWATGEMHTGFGG